MSYRDREGFEPDELAVVRIRKALLDWGRKNQRDFPWRRTRDPYRILLSEMLLQRTRAAQVAGLYGELVRRYPSVRDLAGADPGELRRILSPLGLHWRIPLIHETARRIVERHGGEIPADRGLLESLPGIGAYAASAVLSFAFNLPEPVLDANTVRLVGRLFGIGVTDSSRRSRRFRELAGRLVDRENPRFFNYSFLDLASTVCRSGKPDCGVCPLSEVCYYNAMKMKNFGSGRENTGG